MTRKLLVALLLCTSLFSLGSFAVTAQDDSSGNVPMFRANPARTGEMPGPGPDMSQGIGERWSFHTGGGIVSSPAVVDGTVYVGSEDGLLYAIDAETSQLRWTVRREGSIDSSPAVSGNTVYVGDSNGKLIAIDRESGEQLWTFDSQRLETSAPVIAGNSVIFETFDGSLFAVDATTGQQRWAIETHTLDESGAQGVAYAGYIPNASPAVFDGMVYSGDRDGFLRAVDAKTGEQLWASQPGKEIVSTPVVVADVVYVGGHDGMVYALAAKSGEQLWNFQINGSINSSPAVVDGTLYIGSGDGKLYAIDAQSGHLAWTFDTLLMIESSPAVVDGVVYFGSDDGTLYAVDTQFGQELWSFPTGDSVASSPAVINGVVYVGSNDANLYAIGKPTADMLTTTAQAQSTAIAQANLAATSIAASNATSTAQAQATETAIAQPTVDASATQQAIEQSWQTYFWTDFQNALTSSLADLPGMSLATGAEGAYSPNFPTDSARAAIYQITIAGGTAGAWTALFIYRSSDEANTAMATMSGGLLRSGWQAADVDGLDHDHACLTLQSTDSSEAICYMTRDDVLIVSDSTVGVPTPDAALLNAVDLTNAMSDAYDQVDRPTDLGPEFGDTQ